jgi:hypothetical protein
MIVLTMLLMVLLAMLMMLMMVMNTIMSAMVFACWLVMVDRWFGGLVVGWPPGAGRSSVVVGGPVAAGWWLVVRGRLVDRLADGRSRPRWFPGGSC